MDLAKKYAKATWNDSATNTTCVWRNPHNRTQARAKRALKKMGKNKATKVAFKDWD